MLDGNVFSREALRIYREAADCAKRAQKPLDSSHLVLAIFLVPCEAKSILLEKRLDMERVLAQLPVADPEPAETIGILYSTAAQVAQNLGSSPVGSVHLLLAISRLSTCRAARLLDRAGLPMYALRTHAMAHLTDPRLRRAATERLLAEQGSDPLHLVHVGAAAPTAAIHRHAAREAPATDRNPDDDEVIEFGFDATPMDTPEEPAPSENPEPAREPRIEPSEYRFSLPEDRFPTLCSLGHNLTLLAEKGLLDPLIGREEDLNAVVDVLSKRRANNPLLLGDPGVGKTALVEGLASLIVREGDRVPALAGRIIVAVSVSDLLAGTGVRGSFEARLKALKNEVLAANRQVILFIDEIHTLIGAGVGDGSPDAANDLKGALARGEFPCIGATTFGEYRRFIQPDPALDRRFEKITLHEPSQEQSDRILEGIAPLYERFHHVRFQPDALRSAVRLTDRFIADRSLPAKAIDLLDRAGARVRREGRDLVTREDVVMALSGLVDLPRAFLCVSPAEALRGVERALAQRIVAHSGCIATVLRVLARNWSRFGSRRPLGAYLFVGPHGVGKYALAQALAESLFGTPQALLDVDLGDYSEPSSLSHLIGSPPGYVGHEEGGLLSDTLTRRPFLVVVWRNAGEAHPTVQGLLAQILGEGTATDRRGRRMDFRNTIHVFLADDERSFGDSHRVGFGPRADADPNAAGNRYRASEFQKVLPGELYHALDEVVVFSRLQAPDLAELARRALRAACGSFEREHGVVLAIEPQALDALAARCSEGARTAGAVEARVHELLTRPAVDHVFAQSVAPGATLAVRLLDAARAQEPVAFEIVSNWPG